MKAKCKYNGKETTWPCSCKSCPLFLDCLTEYESKIKIDTHPSTNFEKIHNMNIEEMAVNNVRALVLPARMYILYVTSDGYQSENISEAIEHEFDWLRSIPLAKEKK